jgi:phage terminase large subunit-like protein
LSARVRIKQREAIHEGNAGYIRVLAADVDTSDGVTPSLAVVDELHRHKTPELAGLLRDGLGPREGRMLTISTAGDDEATPLGRLRAKAYTLPGMARDGAHRYVRSGDSFAFHEWALDPDADADDLEQVKAANPAPWLTVDELRERHDSPSTTSWQWRRFACGMWVSGEGSAISSVEWSACADPDCEIPDGASDVYVGVDLGWKHDRTALVPVWRPGKGGLIRVGRPVILSPPGDGTSLPVEDVFAACAAMARTWPQLTFVLDPLAGGEHLAQRLDADLPKVTVATHSQAHTPMCLASARLSEAIAERRIRHPDDEELTAHVLAAGVRQVGEQWRFGKQKGRDAPIDAVIALSMAVSTLLGDDGRRKRTGEAKFL